MAKAKVDIETLGEYMLARHAGERNAAIAAVNPLIQDGGSGMTEAQRRETMKKFREAGLITDEASADGGKGVLRELAQRVDRMVERTRLLIERGGLEDAGLVQAWRDSYKYYVPLHGFASDQNADGKPSRTGQGPVSYTHLTLPTTPYV